MKLKTIPSIIMSFSLAILAEEIQISGTVSNQAGKPITGAVVFLKGQNIKDTTDTKGEYNLNKSASSVRESSVMLRTENISLNNGNLHIKLSKSAQVKIEMYNMSGNLLKKEFDQYISAGEYRYNVAGNDFASGMTLVRVSVEGRSTTFRLTPEQKGRYAMAHSTSGSSSVKNTAMAKIQAALDNLEVTAPNCTTKVLPVTSFQQKINVTMDTLAHFSFFLTSLKALRLLSGNSKGFGGDLRFGKTGQGAGLLGADSICSCVAEMSMKGARFKQWRAFLSVAKGPEGTQVNAIDRIGKGPWYDRVGRLLANNKSELLSTRPTSADPAIKNDFPNEDGVPNHQPDPTKSAVDNHQTITGSDSLGRLYNANATCGDWTQVTGQGGSKPRAGLSWPQSFGGMMGMKHWISVMDLSGCEPGIDSTEASLGGVRNVYTIGNGGGYGGFYCFGLNP